MGWQVVYHYGTDEGAARRYFEGRSLETDHMLAIELLTDAGVRDDVEVLATDGVQPYWQPGSLNWRVAYDYGDDEVAAGYVFEALETAHPFDRADYIYLFSAVNELLATFDVLRDSHYGDPGSDA